MTKIELNTPIGRIPISPSMFLLMQLAVAVAGTAITIWGAMNGSRLALIVGSVVLVLVAVAGHVTSPEISEYQRGS